MTPKSITDQITNGSTSLKGVLSRFRGADNSPQMLRDLLRTSMDFQFYRSTYPEAAALTPFEAADHYNTVGAAEGKNPTAWFNTSHYVSSNPDVVATGMNPFLHYIIYGQAEGRSPAPGVAPQAMLAPTAAHAAPPAAVVIDAESVETPAPAPLPAPAPSLEPTKAEALMDQHYYLARYPHAAELVSHGHFRDAAHHYTTTGWIEGLDPHPLFSSSYYQRLSHQPIIHGDPFEHYLLVGHRQGHNPSPLFDGAWFSAEYPDLLAGGVSPLEAHISNPHTFPNSAREFFTAQFDGTLGAHLGACPRAAAELCTSMPAEFMTWPSTVARFGPDLGFGQLPNDYPFSGERRPQRIDAPIFVFATKADAAAGSDALQASTHQTLVAARAMTTGPVVVLAPRPIDSLITDLIAGVEATHRTLYAELDIASNVAMAARDLELELGSVLVLGVGIEPTLNSGSTLIKALASDTDIAIAGAAILDRTYRIRNVGFEMAGGALVARGAGLSPVYPQLQSPDPIRSIDPRYFALSLEAVAELDPIAGADMRATMVGLVDTLRAEGHQVVVNTSVFGVESESAAADEVAPLTVAPAPAADTDHESRKHILVLDVGWLTPDRDAGSVYTYNVIKILLDEGHRVSFSAPNLRYHPTYTPLLTGLGVNCLYNIDDSNFIAPNLGEDDAPDAIYMFRYPIGRGYHFEFRDRFPKAKFAFHSLDMHGLRELRQAELAGDLRGINAANRTLVDELLLFEEFDASTVVSEHEIGFVEQRCEDANLHVLAIPVEEPDTFASYGPDGDICFVGSFKHLPNIDAVEWFIDSVWPLVLEQDPTRTFHIVGQALPDSVDIDRPGVEYHGFVDDLDGFLSTMRLSVAPLRFGAGIKGKVLTSLAAGLPIVATPMAVEGMGIDDGKHALIAKDPQGFADAVLELLGDKRQWNKISKNGKSLIEAKFSMRAVREQLISSTASMGVNLDRSER